ncbi:glycosyltransferase family 4 protein [Shinella pollutisoli]|uniref:Glycosyltransferase family 4 protein n=1 Tax=Shinella pollutisoli TaxID=2250594 RepID=A0ABV7DH82_9HYPH|nr:glycosyltransferase family 4 protein [Shinella pollutisoli]
MYRPVILAPLDHYLPGFKAGGALRSITNLVDRLSDEFDFRIICADRDLGDAAPYPDIAGRRWVHVGPAQVYYTAPQERTLVSLSRILREVPHHLLYLNSFFSPRFTILPLLARRLGLIPRRPTILAPRGEFSPGALALKRRKKQIHLTASKTTGLLTAVAWQASTEQESADIRSALGPCAADVRVAADLSSPLGPRPPPHGPRAPGAPLRVLFLGRISPMKNLDYALRVLASVRVPVVFSVVGPPEDAAYRADCERLAARLPAHVAVDWRGPVDPSHVARVMAAHDLFFLPTRGENFGHVVAEALGAGTPVLLSDTTPWRGLAAAGVGDDLPLADPSAFAAAIERAAAATPGEAAARRTRVFAHARERQRTSADVEANRMLFTAALGGRQAAAALT